MLIVNIACRLSWHLRKQTSRTRLTRSIFSTNRSGSLRRSTPLARSAPNPQFSIRSNHCAQVPAITYGGPDVDPEDPSPLSFKLAESRVILQFIAELYPESGLLPNDPVERAKVLFFMDTVDRHFDGPGIEWRVGRTESYEGYLKGVEMVQGLLPESGEFAVGDRYTIADACIAPLLSRLKVTCETDIGRFQVGQGHKLGEELKTPKFAKFMRYAQTMLERPSLRDSNDEVRRCIKR